MVTTMQHIALISQQRKTCGCMAVAYVSHVMGDTTHPTTLHLYGEIIGEPVETHGVRAIRATLII